MIKKAFSPTSRLVVFPGDCRELLRSVPDECVQLVVTSPPYNIGKVYERRVELNAYATEQLTIALGD